MKNSMSFLVSFITLSMISPAFAQQNASAKKVLAEVSQKYDGYSTVQATFSFSATAAGNKSSYSEVGTLYLDKKSNKYQISMKGQDLISDSKSLYTILKNEKEVQIAEVEKNTDAIDPSTIFSFYKTGFNYVLKGNEKSAGSTLNVIELSPTDSKKNYSKIKLRVHQTTKLIQDATVFDKNGGKYTYSLQSQTANKKLNANLFSFDKSKYSGYEIVDLR